MDDHPLGDGSFDRGDVEFDEQLRARLALERIGSPDGPEAALAALRPRFARARRVRRAQVAGMVLAPLTLLAVGLVSLPQLVDRPDRQATVAGEPDAVPDTAQSDETEALRVTGTTSGEPLTPDRNDETDRSAGDAGQAADPDGGVDGDPEDPVDPDVSEPSTTVTTAGVQTTSPATSTDGPSSSQTTPTTARTTSIPGSELGETACGDVVVRVVDGEAELLETRPDDGYRVDVKSTGPEVEVSFEGGGGHCEIHVEVERGRLVFSAEDER